MTPGSGADHRHPAGPPSEARGERSRLAREIVQNLRMVFRAVQAHSRWVEKQCGVSAAQLWALWELAGTPGMRVSELSAALSLHQSTTSNLLDKLEAKGLARRARGDGDQRVVRLYITDHGRALVERAPRPAQGALMDALERLPDEGLRELNDGLVRLVDGIGVEDDRAVLEPLPDD